MSRLSDLCLQTIQPTDGIPLGYDDWRFVVRIAKATSDAVLGNFILGTDVLSPIQWVDVTAYAHGVEIERGATAGQRPGAGQVSFWLDNTDGQFDPSLSIYHGPGTLVQVAIGPGGLSVPDTHWLITALTIEWNEASDASSAIRRVMVTAIETVSLLGEIDDPALGAPVGAGEYMYYRIQRIAAAASWQFLWGDSLPGPVNTWGLQGTTLAQDLWTEILLAADSLAAWVVSSKRGDLIVTSKDRGFVAIGLETLGDDIPIVNDSVVTNNDDDQLIGTYALARVGGTVVTYSASGIQGRYQRRSKRRFDLITQDPGGNADLARVANDAFGQGNQTYRVESVELDSGHHDIVWEFLARMDIGTRVNINKQDSPTTGVLFSAYLVCGYTITLSPVNDTEIVAYATVRTTPQALSTYARYS